jgi:hypothetical protein
MSSIPVNIPMQKSILKRYAFDQILCMKNLSLKLEDNIYQETERITAKLRVARNRYINEAVDLLNRYHSRRLLKAQLSKESSLTAVDSMDVLKEMEKLLDNNQAI